ncbi:MAG: glycoside hydrolase family 43 protein [Flavobacteriales bacterium]|nr:glycoside hydrolase family 43 protein [Flavobacteriales bacterium]
MVEGDDGNRAQVGVHVYSSEDLYNWTDEGIALAVIENDLSSEIAKGCILERPRVIYNENTNRFVMWFHLEHRNTGYNGALAGVAVAKNPTGPFRFVHSLRPNAGHWPENVLPFHKQAVADSIKDHYWGWDGALPAHVDSLNLLGRDFEKGQMARDMTLFVDVDGKGYHLYSSEENSTLHISQLSEDYLSHSGKYTRVFVGRYMEAPTMFRNSDDKYFIIASGCTGWAPNAARSAVANHIFGPWKELGNPCSGPNSDLTFNSQGTFILPIRGKKDAFIFMADRWYPKNPIEGKYVWLPIRIENDIPILEWSDKWSLDEID